MIKYGIIVFTILTLAISAAGQTCHVKAIQTIEAGCNSYLIITDAGCVLVDAGSHHKMKAFDRAIQKAGISYKDIRYIIITHTHYDHVMNLAEIRDVSNAKIVVHEKEKYHLESGLTPLPSGMTASGKIGIWVTRNFRKSKTIATPVVPDIIVTDVYSLPGFGFTIIPTPGHSEGSISMIVNDTICFCGDAAFAVMGKNLMPITGMSKPIILDTWKILLAQGIKYFYPGHGKPFTDVQLLKSLKANEEK